MQRLLESRGVAAGRRYEIVGHAAVAAHFVDAGRGPAAASQEPGNVHRTDRIGASASASGAYAAAATAAIGSAQHGFWTSELRNGAAGQLT